jgi:HlyD family secretion protein
MTAGPDKNTLDSLRIDRSTPRASGASWGWASLVILSLVVLGTGAWWVWGRAASPTVKTVPVRELSSGGNQTVLNASGYVTARRQATVSSKVTGKVLEVFAEEGMRVEEGQVLARLDDTNVRTNLRLTEAQLEVARATMGETHAQLEQAEKELDRITSLAKNNIASTSDLDRAQADARTLKARLVRQEREIDAALRQIEIWKQQIEDNVIRAPFSGIVVSKNAQPGEMISPMSAGGSYTRTGICTIVDMASLEIEVDVNESFIGRVETGQGTVATLDSYPNWKIPSRVIAIIPTADRQKATVKVRIGLVKLDPRILPDMGVKVAFHGAENVATAASSTLAIPKLALRDSNGKSAVFVLQNGRIERRAVSVAQIKNEEAILAAGLAAGEKVVIESSVPIKEGDRVSEAKP